MAKGPMIEIENFMSPGTKHRVDAAKYAAMKAAVLAVIPHGEPGMTVAALRTALAPYLSEELFPGGAKAGWWLKAVQLDLEAKAQIRRMTGSPVRLFRIAAQTDNGDESFG